MIKHVTKVLKKIDNDALYSPEQIHDMGVIVNTKLEPSLFTLYRLIRNGKIPAVDIGTGGSSRHFVKGKDLKAYLEETYKI